MTIEKLQLILANIALLFMMHVLLSAVHSKLKPFNTKFTYLLQVTIVSLTSIAMLYFPIAFGDFRFDFRALPLMLLAFILGWKHTIPALILVSLVRFSFGGEGAIPGVIYGTMIPTIVAMLLSKNAFAMKNVFRYLTGSVAVILSSDLFIIIVVPNGWEVFKDIFPLRFLFFVSSAYMIYLMVMENRKRLELQNRLKFFANHDPLTGLYNNRRFFEKVKEVFIKKDGPYYIAMVDIDYFKKINDTYGHVSGDKILSAFANLLLSNSGKNLVVGRYGGEEFIIHISGMSPVGVLNKLEAIRNDIERTTFYTHENEPMTLTASIGFTNYVNVQNMELTIDIADQELYKAKRNGRNQISSNLIEQINKKS
ncbi:GGDEF domain-containing protein [Lottiidibacillus patelloidae]|nr:diguanylate cyclase [Lottiidibacillus patelloidae]